MADIFVSYAREDRAKAEQIAQALQATGLDVFWDTEIPPGQTWADYIEHKLANCKAALVLWSGTSTQSQWVREEARLAKERGKLIPVQLDSSPMPFGFGEVQASNLSHWTGDVNDRDFQRLLTAVRDAAARVAAPPPAPPPHHAPSPPSFQPAYGGSQPVSGAPAAESSQAQLVYILYLISVLVGITAIVGLVMSYMAKDKGPDWVRSHHLFLIYTFWIGLLYAVVGVVLSAVGIGFLILLFVLVWWIVRCVQGLNYLSKSQPIPNPRSWLFA